MPSKTTRKLATFTLCAALLLPTTATAGGSQIEMCELTLTKCDRAVEALKSQVAGLKSERDLLKKQHERMSGRLKEGRSDDMILHMVVVGVIAFASGWALARR